MQFESLVRCQVLAIPRKAEQLINFLCIFEIYDKQPCTFNIVPSQYFFRVDIIMDHSTAVHILYCVNLISVKQKFYLILCYKADGGPAEFPSHDFFENVAQVAAQIIHDSPYGITERASPMDGRYVLAVIFLVGCLDKGYNFLGYVFSIFCRICTHGRSWNDPWCLGSGPNMFFVFWLNWYIL